MKVSERRITLSQLPQATGSFHFCCPHINAQGPLTVTDLLVFAVVAPHLLTLSCHICKEFHFFKAPLERNQSHTSQNRLSEIKINGLINKAETLKRFLVQV